MVGDALAQYILTPADLEALIVRLSEQGFDVLGPTLEDRVIRLAPITSADEFPRGVRDEQEPGRYRTTVASDNEYFGYAVGPTSLKATLFPPRRPVWTSEAQDGVTHFQSAAPTHRSTAVVGARPCDLAAIEVQDRVLAEGDYVDPDYIARRRDLFVVVANCTRPAATCFCTSMGGSPAASRGFDIALTEMHTEDRHYFLAESGSEAGEAMLGHFEVALATPGQQAAAAKALDMASKLMPRRLITDDIHDLLQLNPDHPQWASIAERCLSCANCTMVCPTCFCTSTEPTTDLEGAAVGEDRRWDSCFSLDFSYMGGHSLRSSVSSRYRQWLTHKLSTWIDQFGSSGCVGCGRCITWCPVGIDLTEEIPRLREKAHV